jgi:hypothetical protein
MGEQRFMMKSEVVGRPSVVSDDDVQNVHQKNLRKNFRFFMGIPTNFGYRDRLQ